MVQRRPLSQRRLVITALSSNDLKNGMNIEVDGVPMKVRGSSVSFARGIIRCDFNGFQTSTHECHGFVELGLMRYLLRVMATQVVEFLHVKPGKGAAFVRSKLKNLLNGSTQEKTFRAGEPVGEAQVNKVEMQFSYDDGEAYQFMNLETFETEAVDKATIGSSGNFLLESMTVQVRTMSLPWEQLHGA